MGTSMYASNESAPISVAYSVLKQIPVLWKKDLITNQTMQCSRVHVISPSLHSLRKTTNGEPWGKW